MQASNTWLTVTHRAAQHSWVHAGKPCSIPLQVVLLYKKASQYHLFTIVRSLELHRADDCYCWQALLAGLAVNLWYRHLSRQL